MATSWPEHTEIESNFNDVSQLAQVFELHCAKIYAHAASHPDHPASADYVRQLVSQAYRAVHSLNMQNMASSCLDLEVATATLDNKAKEYSQGPELLSPVDDAKTCEPEIETDSHTQTDENEVRLGLQDLLTGNFEDEDEEEDSDWSDESDSDEDDEYYEYCSGSEAELDLDELEAVARTSTFQNAQNALQSELEEKKNAIIEERVLEANDIIANQQQEPVSTTTTTTMPMSSPFPANEPETPSPPPVSIIQDQAMHDRITAALRTIPLPCHESELEEIPLQLARIETQTIPLSRMETHTVPLARVQTHRPATTSTVSPTETDTSEATAVQTEGSSPETRCTTSVTAPPAVTVVGAGGMARKPSFDASRLHRKLSMRSSSAGGLPRRLKTVCYKYVRRAMVPIRGESSSSN
ncbi:hypothetical protein N7533_004075 [Penicillium manginii]|uniref:uncharacterized protein n=1 Tax=Penicillium manginii TaxID=203109 RepID=UPI0025495824|nr:uncharacterized protein N7533_004075 [Penicillium manginii]KAJ5754532.1 hypothetical protein N7533_004075 [Penicillium manginii]